MKIVAYYALHYGYEWLKWSMRSIRDHVDEIVVVYSDKPSHGHWTTNKPPDGDSEDALRAIASDFQVIWYNIEHSHWEGTHRDFAVEKCEDREADIVLVVDHDEIWEPDMLQFMLEYVKVSPARNFRVPFRHFWRSVSWVCYDPAMPVRLHKLTGVGDFSIGYDGWVNHFGYAQKPETIKYKWYIHGHLPELREGWYDRAFMMWEPWMKDVHPTNLNFWNPIPFNKHELESLIGDHPYFQLDIIK